MSAWRVVVAGLALVALTACGERLRLQAAAMPMQAAEARALAGPARPPVPECHLIRMEDAVAHFRLEDAEGRCTLLLPRLMKQDDIRLRASAGDTTASLEVRGEDGTLHATEGWIRWQPSSPDRWQAEIVGVDTAPPRMGAFRGTLDVPAPMGLP
jgi:hypothetical protein